MQRLALTLIAEDQPGIVGRVAGVVAEHGGNWLDSRMVRLAGRFAGVLLIEVPAEKSAALEGALTTLAGLSVNVLPADGAETAGSRITLSVVGHDRPRIVEQVSRVLADAAINVESLQTSTRAMPGGGGQLFEANAEVNVPDGTNLEAVRSSLENIANDLMVDIEWTGENTGSWAATR